MGRRISVLALLGASFVFIAPHVAQAQQACSSPAWGMDVAYQGGTQVTYSSAQYQAKWWTRGDNPTQGGAWQKLGDCVGGGTGGDPAPAPAPVGNIPTLEDVQRIEAEKTSSPLFQQVKASIRTLDNAAVEAVAPGRASNPANVKRIELILTATDWDYLFPQREPSYTYTRFLQASAKFPALCGDYTDGRDAQAICRKTLATMFAHFAQETGGHNRNDSIPEWRQALVHLREMGCNETGPGCEYNAECNPAVWQSKVWPCGRNGDGSFKKYFGRGAKQLSYNFNYGPFSEAMFGNVRQLLDSPDLVASTWLNLASASFFYIYPQPPKPSMLAIVDGSWQPNAVDRAANISAGFGATINIINGGIECGQGVDKPQALNRIAYYQEFARYLGVPVAANEQLGCANQKQFQAGGAGALDIYWEMDWSYNPSYPDGKSYACKLVSYQTPYSALRQGDYKKCVEANFSVVIGGGGGGNPGNAAPTANAGADQGVNEAAQVTLVGSGTDPDGTIASYQWTQSAGPAVMLSNATMARASFMAPQVNADTALTFQLRVTDNKGAAASDTVVVNVRNVGTANNPPAAQAGADFTVNEGATARLAGAGSDSDGTVVSYRWMQTSGVVVALSAANAANASFIAPQVTADSVVVLQLTITDNQGATSSDSVAVTIRNQASGGQACTDSAWNRNSVYVSGSRVTHQNATYEARWWTQGDDPAQAVSANQTSVWRKVHDCSSAALNIDSASATDVNSRNLLSSLSSGDLADAVSTHAASVFGALGG